jgi:UDPglucose 6-dehydrogenase
MESRFKGKIAVMGVGWVGGAVARWLDDAGLEPLRYDPPKGLGTEADLAAAEIVFVCLPTPYDEAKGGFDLSYVEEGIRALPDGKIVVIKSTVLPGTTEELQRKNPRHRFVFNPEFLRQATADADFRAPDRQLVGVTDASRSAADDVLAVLPAAPFTRVLGATEAEAVKYFGNCFLALKVVFANQLFDLCRAVGADYDAVKDCAAADPRIGPSHLQVIHDGYRGYGGSCFPKDVRALIQLGDALGAEQELLKACERLNAQVIAKNPAPATVR